MVAGADGPHEPVDVGADRPCGVAAALTQVERQDEEDRVPRGRQRHLLGNHTHVLDKTVMLTREGTPELHPAGESSSDRIAQRSSKQPEWRERPEGCSHDTDLARVRRRRRSTGGDAARVPPGQYVTDDFPVLSAGPTPHADSRSGASTSAARSTSPLLDLGGVPAAAAGDGHRRHPLRDEVVEARHDVDRRLGRHAARRRRDERRVRARPGRDGGYTTNLPLEDVAGGKAWVAFEYDDEPLEPEHGGPARLLVPHLYFWKSAKWVRGLELSSRTSPASGRATATTTTGTRGKNSGTPATDLAARDGGRARRGDRADAEHRARSAGLAGASRRPARRRAADRRGRLPGAAQLLDRVGARGRAARAHRRAARRRRGLAVPHRRAPPGRRARAARADRRLLRLGGRRSAGRCCSSPAARASSRSGRCCATTGRSGATCPCGCSTRRARSTT